MDFAHVELYGNFIITHMDSGTLENGEYDRKEKGSNAMKLVWRNHM